MNILKTEKRIAVVTALVNGNGIRATARVTGVSIPTVLSTLVSVGANCDRIMRDTMKGLNLTNLELDEIWTFNGKKERRLRGAENFRPDLGDQFLFTCLDRASKCVPAWALGKRTSATALELMDRLGASLNGCRPQISSDQWDGYQNVIEETFGADCSYGTITKAYESVHVGPGRYAPPRVSGVDREIVMGDPDWNLICTSHVERNNLTIRTFLRRFTRLALGFSRKIENLRAAIALFMAYYNLCWTPRTLKGISPAMAAKATDRLWDVADLIA